MNRIQYPLMIAIAGISGLLLYLSFLGLGLTHNLFYLVSLGCCLYTLLFTAYLLLKPNQPPTTSREIHVVVVHNFEPAPNPLWTKVMERM